MTKTNRFSNMSSEELLKAQDELNELCKKYALKSWKITAKKGRWKELCLRMAGIPPLEAEKSGRREKRTQEEKEHIVKTVEIIDGFDAYDEHGNVMRSYKYQAREIAAKHCGIEPEEYGRNKISNPAEVVRGVCDKVKKECTK